MNDLLNGFKKIDRVVEVGANIDTVEASEFSNEPIICVNNCNSKEEVQSLRETLERSFNKSVEN